MIVWTDGSNATKLSKFDDRHLRAPASSQTAYVSNLIPLRRASVLQEQMLRVLTTSISSSRRMPLRSIRPSGLVRGDSSEDASRVTFALSGFGAAGPAAEAGLAVVAVATMAAASQAAARWQRWDGKASVAIVITRIIDMAATN